jgi:hypothetical protein
MAANDAQPVQTENVEIAKILLAWEMTKGSLSWVRVSSPDDVRLELEKNYATIAKVMVGENSAKTPAA